MNDKTKLGVRILVAALILGVLGDALLRTGPWGINAFLWATALAATGVYTGQPRGMIFVVVTRKELDDLKALVGAIDPTAMVIISDVHEAIGEGFKEMRT